MKISVFAVNLVIVGLIAAMFLSVTISFTGLNLFAANTANSNVVASLTVPSQCQISLSNTAVTFPSTAPGAGTAVGNAVAVTNNGNLQAAISVYGANWIGAQTTVNFFVANTLWNSASAGAGIGTALSFTITNTLIYVPAVATNNIFFGVNIPNGQTANTYTQQIAIVNSC